MASRKIVILDSKFTQLKAESGQETNAPIETSDSLDTALSFLLAYDYANSEWTRVLSDSDGRILVSSGATKTNEANHSSLVTSAVSQTLIDENGDRKAIYIQNIGTQNAYLKYGEAAVVGEGILILPNATFIDDLYYGDIFAISSVATTLLVTELT